MPSPLMRLLRYASDHRGTVVWASICSVLNKIFDLAPPVLIGMAVDTVVNRESSLLGGLGVTDLFNQLVAIAVLTVVIWGLESIFEYLFQWLWRNLAQTMQHELRLDAYDHVQKLDLAWFQGRSSGGLLAVLNDDVNQLERFLDGGANSLLQLTTTVIAVTAVFIAASPGVAGLALIPVPIILWGSFWFQGKLAPRYLEVRKRAADVSAQLADNLGGIETIRSFVAEEAELGRVSDESNAYRKANRRAIMLSSSFSPLIRMAIVVGFTATLIYGGWLTVNDEMGVGTYSVLVFLTQRLLWPLTSIGQTFDLYQRAMASTTRILDLIDTPVGIQSGERRITGVQGKICFEGVRFAYPGRDPVLDDFDLCIEAGHTVAVVGPTGAGKSTLVRLLLRLYEPDLGRVTVDGVDLRELDLGDLRRAVGLVSQSVFLFPGSVADNLRYGKLDATDAEVHQAAGLAEAEDFILALPEGYDTTVGERGQKLSGGQRQRLSIARAILKDPPVLVLDEATSAVDNETEAAIQRSLARVGRGRTVLVIAHRLSTIRHADRILVMDRGEIVQSGTHEQLVASGGLYARLWAVQTGETT